MDARLVLAALLEAEVRMEEWWDSTTASAALGMQESYPSEEQIEDFAAREKARNAILEDMRQLRQHYQKYFTK